MSAPVLIPPTYLSPAGIPLPDPGLSFVKPAWPITFNRNKWAVGDANILATIGIIRYYPDNGHVLIAAFEGTTSPEDERLLDAAGEVRQHPPRDDAGGWEEIVDARGRRALQQECHTSWTLDRVLTVLTL